MNIVAAGLRVLPDGGHLHGRQPHPAAAAEGREQRVGVSLHGQVRGAAGVGPRRPGQPRVPGHRLGPRGQAQGSPRSSAAARPDPAVRAVRRAARARLRAPRRLQGAERDMRAHQHGGGRRRQPRAEALPQAPTAHNQSPR